MRKGTSAASASVERVLEGVIEPSLGVGIVEMSPVEETKRAVPRRGAVKARIFSNIYNGIRSLVLPDGAEALEYQSVACDDNPNSGPQDTSMMVKDS